MRRVQVSFQDMPRGIAIVFMENHRALGRTLRFVNPAKLDEMLFRAGASLEDRNIANYALSQRRAGMLELTLTDEQYARLRRSLGKR